MTCTTSLKILTDQKTYHYTRDRLEEGPNFGVRCIFPHKLLSLNLQFKVKGDEFLNLNSVVFKKIFMQEKYLYIDDIFAHVMIIVARRAENFGKKNAKQLPHYRKANKS